MDFKSDIDQILADEVDELPPKTKIEAFWRWLM
jgi:amino acid transporter